MRVLYCKSVMHLKEGSLSFTGVWNAYFCLSTKILMYHPLLRLTFLFRPPLCIWVVVLLLSSTLCLFQRRPQTPGHQVSAFTPFSFQFSIFLIFLLFILFLLLVSTTMEVVSSFPFFFFLGMNWCRTRPGYNARLLLFSSFRFLLCLSSRVGLPQPRTCVGIVSFSWGLGVNKGAELCDCV